MKRMRSILSLPAILLCLAASGCTPGGVAGGGAAGGAVATAEGNGNGPLRIVATTAQVADILTSIGGEHVSVEVLMGPGVDPHLYKATPGDTRKLNGAQAVFYSGLHLEGRLADLLESLAARKPSFAVTEGVKAEQPDLLRTAAQFEGAYDPHVWFDVALWSKCADHAAKQLIKIDPKHAAEHRQAADKYLKRLDALHGWCGTELAKIPKDRRVLVTAHDAFEYLGAAYEIEVHGMQGISTVDEPDLEAVNGLVSLLVERQIKAVFVESSVAPKNVQALIEGCASRGHEVTIGGELYSDAMGTPGTPAGTYEGMIKHNVNTIVKALR